MDLGYIYNARKRPSLKTPEGKPNLVVIGAAVGILILIGGVVTYFVLRTRTENISPAKTLEECAQVLTRSQEGKLVLSICVKKNGNMSVIWENLPEGTKSLKIYRRKTGESTDSLWAEIATNSRSGSAEIKNPGGASDYFYKAEALGATGKVLWDSETASIQYSSTGSNTTTPGASTPSTPPGGSQSPQNNTPTSPPPVATPPADPGPSTPPPSTPPGGETTPTSSPPSEVPGQTYYYTPSGQVSGTSTPETAIFWVRHVNKKIEIGWQNLPAGTTKIVIQRSLFENSGYETLLTQNNPNIQSDFIRLDDHSINQAYYYQMKTYSGSSLTNTYGPILLVGL
ncbi:MAG: hypothetical protein G01um101420_583 [Parcubacteria group bacterium Gr01-1014_20]|nr:MAG: hypothetical protein G01um101420_583 [Parcubacteria group bacterium Gr01-1014_20]